MPTGQDGSCEVVEDAVTDADEGIEVGHRTVTDESISRLSVLRVILKPSSHLR